MKEFTLPEQVLKEMINHLAKQPLGEVLELFTAIQQSAKEVKPEEEKEA